MTQVAENDALLIHVLSAPVPLVDPKVPDDERAKDFWFVSQCKCLPGFSHLVGHQVGVSRVSRVARGAGEGGSKGAKRCPCDGYLRNKPRIRVKHRFGCLNIPVQGSNVVGHQLHVIDLEREKRSEPENQQTWLKIPAGRLALVLFF